MKKIPTLFERIFEDHKIIDILPNVYPGMEWVLDGKGIATVKYDGACCMVKDNRIYKRYDATTKYKRKIPKNAIPCQEKPDPVTGHFPCWVSCEPVKADRFFLEALENYRTYFRTDIVPDGTYECVGPMLRRNPYRLSKHMLIPHGRDVIDVPRSFEEIRDYLKDHDIEGIVFWKDGEPRCKIKKTDFGFVWTPMCPDPRKEPPTCRFTI